MDTQDPKRESAVDRNSSGVLVSQQMDAQDVNYLNELLEQDVEIREVRRLQLAPPNFMANPFRP